jgi:hypothetical protein
MIDDNEAEELLTELEDCIEAISDIEAAEDFRESVAEKCESMRGQYENIGRLTEAQTIAIENMIHGCNRWLTR